MKLTDRIIFTEFICPALDLSLGAGRVVSVDKTELAVLEVERPNLLYIIPRSALFKMTIDIRPKPKEHFWAAGGGATLPIPRET